MPTVNYVCSTDGRSTPGHEVGRRLWKARGPSPETGLARLDPGRRRPTGADDLVHRCRGRQDGEAARSGRGEDPTTRRLVGDDAGLQPCGRLFIRTECEERRRRCWKFATDKVLHRHLDTSTTPSSSVHRRLHHRLELATRWRIRDLQGQRWHRRSPAVDRATCSSAVIGQVRFGPCDGVPPAGPLRRAATCSPRPYSASAGPASPDKQLYASTLYGQVAGRPCRRRIDDGGAAARPVRRRPSAGLAFSRWRAVGRLEIKRAREPHEAQAPGLKTA